MSQATELNPGSFKEFADRTGGTLDSTELRERHGRALTEYRTALAAEQGISLDDLHLKSLGAEALRYAG